MGAANNFQTSFSGEAAFNTNFNTTLSRFSVPQDGLYALNSVVEWQPGTGSIRCIYIFVYDSTDALKFQANSCMTPINLAGNPFYQSAAGTFYLKQSDYVVVKVFSDVLTSIFTNNSAEYQSNFVISRLR